MEKHAAHIIFGPRISEKGAYLAENGVYVFNVSKDANRAEVAGAIQKIFKVTPKAVRFTAVPAKRVQTRGTNRKGMTASGKKAYVHLKKGDTIELM